MRNFRKFLVNRTPIQNFNQVRLLGGFTNLKFIVMLEVYTENNILIDIFSELKNAKYVKSSVFVSKEDAAKVHTEIIGEDFMTFLGANPLQNSFDIHLKADYIDSSNIRKIENKLRENPMISDIVYDKQLVNLVNDNIKKVSFWILIISGFLTLVAVLLINSSMRLSIHSNRFIIKTMQMVGATKAFIRKPFIWKSIKLGLIGSALAVVSLIVTLLYLDSSYPNLGILDEKFLITLVLIGVVGVGIIITWLSTYFATQRFLNLRTDDLY